MLRRAAMIVRVAVVLSLIAAAIVAGVVLLTGGEEAKQTSSALSWAAEPLAFEPRRLPRDRVAIGYIRNTGSKPITMSSDDFEVRDTTEEQLTATFQFIDTYTRGGRGPNPSKEDRLQLGTDVELEVGATSPLTVRYQLDSKTVLPAAVYYKGVGALELPTEPTPPKKAARLAARAGAEGDG